MVEEREEGGVGWTAEVGVGSEGSEWRVIERLPEVSAFEMGDSDARGDTEGPGVEDSGLA